MSGLKITDCRMCQSTAESNKAPARPTPGENSRLPMRKVR
jgi:hypothetical protein